MAFPRFPALRTLSMRVTAGGAITGIIISLLFFAAHSAGPVQASTPSAPLWPKWDIARGVATSAGGNSGYILDGFGGLHPFSLAGRPPDPVTRTGYWRGWDIARGVALRADGRSGYVLDGRGGLHPFGVTGDMPPAVTVTGHWPGDMARGVALTILGPVFAAPIMVNGMLYVSSWDHELHAYGQ